MSGKSFADIAKMRLEEMGVKFSWGLCAGQHLVLVQEPTNADVESILSESLGQRGFRVFYGNGGPKTEARL